MKRIPPTFSRLWSTDSGLTALLIFLVLSIFVFHPLHDIPYFEVIIKILFSLILFSGVVLVLERQIFRVAVLVLVLIGIFCNWAELLLRNVSLGFLSALVNFLCCGFLAAIILVQVFRKGRITAHRIQGAIAVYLLFGLMWGFLYQSIAFSTANAFQFSPTLPPHSKEMLKTELVYFSFVTLTTVGYGDVLALHPFARMLVILEALIGQLFPAILLARLVTLEIMHRNEL